MSSEDEQNEAMSRLGGKTRIGALEARLGALEADMRKASERAKVRPGALITPSVIHSVTWDVGVEHHVAEYRIEALGYDWCVLRQPQGLVPVLLFGMYQGPISEILAPYVY